MIKFSDFYQALRTLSPFVPRSSVDGKVQGVLFDPTYLALSAVGFSSSGFVFLDEALSENRFVIPHFVVDAILRLPSGIEWKGIEFISPTQVKIEAGGLSLRFPVLAADSVTFPQLKGDRCEIKKSFIENLSRNAIFMNEDDRRINLYGMFCGDSGVYACDNYRLVFSAEDIDPKMRGLFLPFPCVQRISKNENITVFQQSGNLLVFATSNSIFCFASLATTFPDVAEHFRKIIDSENPIVVVDNSQESFKTFAGMFSGDKATVPILVKSTGEFLNLEAPEYEPSFQVSYDLPIISQTAEFKEFHVKSKFLLESLLLFKNMKIGEDSVLLYDEKNVHMVMKQAE